jgi:DNA-binding NarL/FixJ family response regulator
VTTPLLQKVRVLLIENEPMVRSAFRLLLEQGNTVKVIKEIGDVKAFLGNAENGTNQIDVPDMIVLSQSQNCKDGVEAISELRQVYDSAKILFLIGECEPSLLQRAVMLGVSGIVTKEQTQEVLLNAVEAVSKGEIWINRQLMAQTLQEFSSKKNVEKDYEHQKISTLTPREHQVINAIGDGLNNKQIRINLRISESTVRHHLSSIYSKLEVKDRLGLAVYAYKHGLITEPNSKSHSS